MATPLISVDNVALRFPLKNAQTCELFSGLNLEISRGEFVTIVGQTGCGKSTLLRMVLGSQRPSTGTIRVNGKLVKGPGPDRGYVPQKYSLFPDKTVLQNIAFGPTVAKCRPHQMLHPQGWRNRAEIREKSFEYLRLVGLREQDACKYPDQLSGGMQQRVAIAQSLILNPQILLMDEAFSALDPATRSGMQRLARELWRNAGITVIFVTHNIAEALYLGTRIILVARNETIGCSHLALDLSVPDHIRDADGHPRSDELVRWSRQLETVAAGGQLEPDGYAAVTNLLTEL